jgi:uncharacterized membrane protein YozB (DUF420 family)
LRLSDLPTLNAFLNSIATVLLLLAFREIRRGRWRRHRGFMIAAFATSSLFLVSYLVYHFQVGSVRYEGTGLLRALYLSILLTHTVLAATVPVLATVTLTLGLRRRDARHRKWAKVAFPVWLYVSVTGVIIYLMLYQLPTG